MAHLIYDPWEMAPEERKARFVGREALLERVISAVGEQQEHGTLQHYLLLGPRGIGKTTLLLTLRDRVREIPSLSAGWFCVQLREEEFFIKTLRDLLDLVLRALAEDERLPDAAELLRQVQEESREERSLALAVDGLRTLAAAHHRRILLLIDNFDRVFPAEASGRYKKRPADNQFRSLRKLLNTENFLMVVGTSVRVFEEIAAYDRAFFNFFCPVEIPNLNDDEICELLRKCAEAEADTRFLEQFDAMRDKVRAITYMTGGNPRLVVMLYDVLRRNEMAPVVEALRETVGGLTPLLKHVLDDMPRQQSKTLDALIRLQGAASPSEMARLARLPLNTVTAQLGRLREARFVRVEGGGKGKSATYRISDPMFHTWYQMRYLRPACRRIELFVEFIRALFSLQERRGFLKERWEILGGSGILRMQDRLLIEYYAATLEDETERQKELGRLADRLVEQGKTRDAAMLLADSVEPAPSTQRGYEAAGYELLGDRMARMGNFSEALAAFREAVTKEPDNVPARLGFGICLAKTGNGERAVVELQRIIDLPDATVGYVEMALVARGLAKGLLGDRQAEIADYTAAAGRAGAPVEVVAGALYMRGVTRASLGDTQGAIVDYTAVLDLDGAPQDSVASAYLYRGIAKESLADSQGAMADCTAVVNLFGAPAEVVARALLNRGAIAAASGNYDQALADMQSVMKVPGVVSELRGLALLGQGAALLNLGKTAEAVARIEEGLALRPETRLVHTAFNALIGVHLRSGRPEDAARAIARLHELEPEGAPVEPRLEARIRAIVAAGKEHSIDTAALLLDAALQNDPEDIRDRLAFLAPAIQYAKTGDEQALAGLPERERDAAKQIAAVLTGKQDRVVGQP